MQRDARATLAQAPQRLRRPSSASPAGQARHEHKPRSADVEVNEAYDRSGGTYDFYAQLFGRRSIDGKGMRLDSTVHYGTRFENAMRNGRQMVYSDGDGRIFNRFTASLDVIGHELTHGVTQFSTALGYSGQPGALNEQPSRAWKCRGARASDLPVVDDAPCAPGQPVQWKPTTFAYARPFATSAR